MSQELLGFFALLEKKLWLLGGAILGIQDSQSGFAREVFTTVVALLIVGGVTGGVAGVVVSYQTRTMQESVLNRMDRMAEQVKENRRNIGDIRTDIAAGKGDDE